MTDDIDSAACAECNGHSVQFRGSGLNMQYRICSRYKEPGHMTWSEIQGCIAEKMRIVRPSGRFA